MKKEKERKQRREKRDKKEEDEHRKEKQQHAGEGDWLGEHTFGCPGTAVKRYKN